MKRFTKCLSFVKANDQIETYRGVAIGMTDDTYNQYYFMKGRRTVKDDDIDKIKSEIDKWLDSRGNKSVHASTDNEAVATIMKLYRDKFNELDSHEKQLLARSYKLHPDVMGPYLEGVVDALQKSGVGVSDAFMEIYNTALSLWK